MRKLSILVLAAATLAGVSAPAAADEVTIRVSYADLNIADDADVAVLKQRIHEAADKACSRAETSSLHNLRSINDCVAEGTAKALAQLNARRKAI